MGCSESRDGPQALSVDQRDSKSTVGSSQSSNDSSHGKSSGVEINFLLLGISESGKTTIYKMLRSVFDSEKGPPSNSEKMAVVKEIKKFVYEGVTKVLKVMKSKEIPFEKEIHEEVANAFLALDPDSLEPGLSAVAKDLVDLWEDEGVQKAYAIIEEKTPLWNLPYFVEKISELSDVITQASSHDGTSTDDVTVTSDQSVSLQLTEQDLSRIEKTTTTVSTQRVTIRGLYTCRVVDVGGSRAERTTKWAQCFRDTTAVMYVVDSSAFDLNLVEAPKKNRLLEALECFELLVSNRWLQGISFVLFLNKQDVLLEKICEHKKKIHAKSVGFVGYSGFELEDDEAKDIEKTAKFLDYPVEDLAEYFKTRAFIKFMFESVFENVRDLSRISKEAPNERFAVFRATSPPSVYYRMNRPFQSNLRGECYSYYMVAVEPDSLNKIFPDAVSCILKEYIHNAKLF